MFDWTKVKEIRISKNMTVKEVADQANTSTQLIKNIEEGRRKDPQISSIIKVCKGLGISIEELMNNEPAESSR
jgi:transcriptional regulator with XRE-family HTH domain